MDAALIVIRKFWLYLPPAMVALVTCCLTDVAAIPIADCASG